MSKIKRITQDRLIKGTTKLYHPDRHRGSEDIGKTRARYGRKE